MSPFAKSCTTYMRAIRVVEQDESFVICDSPGLEDTRGAELDVANIYGVIKTAQCCKTVVPVIVISKKGMGDRM